MAATRSTAQPPRWPWKVLLALSLLFTLLNAAKPLHIDDAAYYYYAAQISRHPLDPYGFQVFWNSRPEPANEVLAPPLLPYWWAPAIGLFGERPFLWKLWLAPIGILFTFSLYALLHWFARGFELPFLILTLFSPAFLPSFNLMLDIPELALALFALATFFRLSPLAPVLGGEGSGVRGLEQATASPPHPNPSPPSTGERGYAAPLTTVVLAGVVAGLAMQTKYTGFLVPAALVLYAVLFRRLTLGLVAVLLAISVFGAWEGFMAVRYGESHFLFHAREGSLALEERASLFWPLLVVVGGVAPALMLLALAALRLPPWLIAVAGVLVVIGYALVAFLPDASTDVINSQMSAVDGLSLNTLLFGSWGVLFWCAVAATSVAITLRVMEPQSSSMLGGDAAAEDHHPFIRRHRVELFLIVWLGLEVAGYFALTPFPAVRRYLGILVVATLLIGRLAAATCRAPARRVLVWSVVAFGVVLGLGFDTIDWCDARARQEAPEAAARWVRDRAGQATIWFTGHWSFQYYAERSGMTPVEPNVSRLRRGDFLVIPDARLVQQSLVVDEAHLELLATIDVGDPLPLRTVMCYYGGYTAIEHLEGPRISVSIYRVRADFF